MSPPIKAPLVPVFGNSWSGGVGPHGGSEHTGGGVGVVVVVGTVVVVVSVSVVLEVVSVVVVVELVGGGEVVVTGGVVGVVVVAQSSLPGWPSFPATPQPCGGTVVVRVVVVVLEVSGGKQSSP